MNPATRDLLKGAFETGYLQALRAVVNGDLSLMAEVEDLDAAARGAAAAYLADVVAAEREAAA